MSDSRRRQRQDRIGCQIALTALVALIMIGSMSQQADPCAERNKFLQLEEIIWSEIAASRYQVKLPTPAKKNVCQHHGSNSTVSGGLEHHLILSEAVPQENAAVMRLVLTTGAPKIRLALEDDGLRFADSIIEAGERVYREEFVDDVDGFVVFAPAQKKPDAASEKQWGASNGVPRAQ